MFRAVVLLVVVTSSTSAQSPELRFQWPRGQAMEYRVVQNTKVRETTVDEKGMKPTTAEVATSLTLTKRWSIREVDAAGTATMDLSITQMRQAVTQGDGKATTIDSANPDDAKQMAAYLNKPVLTLRVDPRGQILEVKEARPGSASRIQSELPFRMVLPEMAVAAGQTWARPFTLTLDPPHGTGERYDATQTFSFKGEKQGLATIRLETSLKNAPATASEKIPLIPMLWSGELVFDIAAGRFHSAQLSAKAELANHQGEGTKFVYESVYTEEAVR